MRRLLEAHDAMSEFAARFDPALLTVEDAKTIRDRAGAIKNMAAAVEAQAAGRVAESGVWKRDGDRSAAHELARATGTTVGKAKETIDTGRRLQLLPSTADAAKKGELSLEQAAAIADAAEADPHAEQRLLDTARSGSVKELRDECGRTKASASNCEQRRRLIHERRRLRTWNDADGAGHLHLCDNPEKIAEIMGEVTPCRDELAHQAQKKARPEPLDAHAADALHQLVCGAAGAETTTSASGRTKILVRIDLDALLRGAPSGDEICEIAGYGPVAVSVVREMLETADPFLVAIATRGEGVVGVAHLGRCPTAHQRSALEWLYPTCAAEGCNSLTYLEYDHTEDWAKTKLTIFDRLDRLCGHHHQLKTTHGWGLVEGRGKRAFVAPDDPRHPRDAERQTAA